MANETPRPLLLPANRKLRHLKGIYLRDVTHTTPIEPRPKQLRRRSTVWAGAPPTVRQKKLEDVISKGMVDTFFTLHVDEEVIYISEVVEKVMNPSFRFFDLTTLPPSISRLDSFTIRIWTKQSQWTLQSEHEIHLSELHITTGTHKIIFHLIDGVYTTDVTPDIPAPKSAPTLPTSSYNALMRLSTLDDSIQDALRTREQLAAQIGTLLHAPDPAPAAIESAQLAKRYVTSDTKLLKNSVKRRDELKASLAARRSAMTQGAEIQARAQDDVVDAREKLEHCKALHRTTLESIHGQRRRICEELLEIFPIEPTSSSLLFTICGLELPNSSFEDANEEVVAAALGHVARLVDHLQYYLSIPLPYPVTAYGSRSLIRDEISILPDNQRTFPLYTRSVIRFRFDYAVFLLNKDIECLAESQGLKVIDIRHTLPNLKYLLYVCSAGAGELPARKAGGVRGLLAGRTPIMSRRGSMDSDQGETVRKVLENGGKKDLPFGNGRQMTLRTSGLRENVVS